MKIRPNPAEKFKVLYNLPKDTYLVINIGGRGGGKSYESSKYITVKAICEGKRTIVMRDEKSKIDESILNEVKKRFGEINDKSNGYIATQFDMQEGILKKRQQKRELEPNEGSLIFTMGFRSSTTGKVAHLKSISDIDIALIEEIEDLNDEDKFNTLADSVRNEGSFVMVNSNVPTKDHWFIRRYFNINPSEHDGYYYIEPKNIEGVVYIITNYKDNSHLQPKLIAKYESYGDPNHANYNPHYYKTNILGLCSSGIKGQIFTGWNRITIEEYNRIEYNKYYYIDWGGTDPCAIGEVKAHNNQLIIKPLHYEPKRFNDVMIWLCEQGFTSKETIIVDSAIGEYMISKMRNGFNESDFDLYTLEKYPQLRRGFTAMGVVKKGLNGKGFIETRIEIMKGYNVSVVEGTEGDNLWNEYTQYVWMLDKDGKPTGQPIDKNNHHIDGSSYVAYALKT